MHSNLTTEDVAKYVNAKILFGESRLNQVAINFKEKELMLISDSGLYGYWYNVDRCHLLLKPLSEISEDDAVEVAKIANVNRAEIQLAIGKDIANSIANKIVDRFAFIPYTNIIDIINYLRKKEYDMDGFLTNNKAKHG
jgi:hypothetical protein